MFDPNNDEPVLILVSKAHKYFIDGNKNHIHYLCYINEQLNKACVIKGIDIMFHRGKYVQIHIGNQIKEFYEISKKYIKIFDID